MNRVIRLILVCLLLVTTGCSSKQIIFNDQYIFSQDDQFKIICRQAQSTNSIAESEDGYYFFSGPGHNAYLYYMDKKTMKPVLLCNKPDCLHTEETNAEKVNDCNAFFMNRNMNLIYYSGSLYLIGEDMGGSGYSQSLYRVSKDGTKREKLITFKEAIYHLIIHRGYIYYNTDDQGTVSGKENTTTTTCKLFRIELNKINQEPELLFTKSGIYGTFDQLFGYGNGVYFQYYCFDCNTQLPIDNALFRYDIVQKTLVKTNEHVGMVTLHNEKIVFNDVDMKVYVSDLFGTDRVELVGVTGGPSGSDDQFIFIPDWNEKDKMKLAVYDWQGSLVKDFGFLGIGFTVYGGNNDYFFVADDGSESNEFGNICALYVVDKQKLRNGTATLEKVFEFIPKTHFPGVLIPSN